MGFAGFACENWDDLFPTLLLHFAIEMLFAGVQGFSHTSPLTLQCFKVQLGSSWRLETLDLLESHKS